MASVTLTIQQIIDLADFAGVMLQEYPVGKNAKEDDFETEITIIEGPTKIYCEETNKPMMHTHCCYITEIPEEGFMPLDDGEELKETNS